MQTLCYPLAIRVPDKKKIVNTLQKCQQWTNEYLEHGYNDNVFSDLAQSRKKSYKVLEPLLKGKVKTKIPSRINRGVLEITGRTLRTVAARKKLFDVLQEMDKNPDNWDYKKLIEEKEVYIKSQWVENLKEQTNNHLNEHGRLPVDFFDMQLEPPKLKRPILSYAADDGPEKGQAIKYCVKKDKIDIEMKVISDDDNEETPSWEWIKFSLPLPQLLQEQKQQKQQKIVAPDLRLSCVHGEWLPVLDFKAEQLVDKCDKTNRFLTIDWGLKKLVTVCVFDRKGQQITTPIFLKFDPLAQKLLRIRKEIDSLKSKRDKLDPEDTDTIKKYNREIARRWRKFRAIQQALAHLASSLIVLIAKIFGASSIYCEWLKSLKSTDKSRLLNWKINSTVRQAIFEKVAYKAKLHALTFHRPVNPYGLSQYCPRCGHKGHHVKASNNLKKTKYGGWFICPSCHYNADRDYVSTINLARKVLFGNSLKDSHKGIFYMKTASPVSLFRQDNHALKLSITRLICGWKKSVFLKTRFFSGTLIF